VGVCLVISGHKTSEANCQISSGGSDSRRARSREVVWLGSAVNLLNSHALTLGGGTLNFGAYLDSGLETLKEHTLPESFSACALRISPLEERLVARGAAYTMTK